MPEIEIVFLGTGPSGRVPKPGCTRPGCLDAKKPGSKSARLQQSTLMRCDNTVVLFDISEDVVEQWRHVPDIPHIDAACISHPHQDAMGGLVRVRTILDRLHQERLRVYAEDATWARTRERFSNLDCLDPRTLRLEETVHVGTFAITPFRVHHDPHEERFPTVGFDIRVADRRIVLITDVKRIPDDRFEHIRNPDLLILDCAIYEMERSAPSHVDFAEAREMVARIAPRRTYFTQIGTTWPPYEEARRIGEQHGIGIPYDGLRVTV